MRVCNFVKATSGLVLSLSTLVGMYDCVYPGIMYLRVHIKWFSFSALTLLVGSQEGHPASKKNCVVGCWRGYLSGAKCRIAYGPADATATHGRLLQ